MKDFEEKMNSIMREDEDWGDNSVSYSMESRVGHDMDRQLLDKLNIPLLRHLAHRADYEAIGTYICGMINQQHADND